VLELGLARTSGLAVVWLEDERGTFVAPTPPDQNGASPYPLVSTVYALVPKEKSAHAATTGAFLAWALAGGPDATRGHEAERPAAMSAFGPLSPAEQQAARAALDGVFGGAP